GDDLRPLTRVKAETDLQFLDDLLTATPYRLIERPRVLILEPGGGLDVLLATRHRAREVVAVESNPLLVQLVGERFDREAGGLYGRPQVTVIQEMGRSYLRRCPEPFDIVQVSLYDSFRPVTSGAYSLAENYYYTVDAFREYLLHLTPGGYLVIHRWLQRPPSEDLRALAMAVEALEGLGIEQPSAHIAALRSFSTALLLVKGSPLNAEEIAGLKAFATERRFDLIYYPGMIEAEADRYFASPEPIYYRTYRQVFESSDRGAFYRSYPFDVSPPSDDKPFFFHFFTLAQLPQILANYGRTFQPFGGSGFLVLWALLLLVLLASLLLILAPLVRLGGFGQLIKERRLALYFVSIGLAFLLVEIPLIQRFILFLGHPVYALGTVLFSVLVFSGLGSAISGRVPMIRAISTLGLAVLFYPTVLSIFFDLALGYPLGLRLVLSVLVLAPLATLMGIPFPRGIAIARQSNAPIPWLWGINGFASVLSAVLAAILALSIGFSWVLVLGGAAYLLSAALIAPLARDRGRLSSQPRR
ncbi:MAG: hypothetical protein HYZ68_01710, partial [Chloroflexi bacterium]|nr:hypothetical protein [Chloroflexota bacterium]